MKIRNSTTVFMAFVLLAAGLSFLYKPRPPVLTQAAAPQAPLPQEVRGAAAHPKQSATLEAGTVRAELSFTQGDTLYDALLSARANGLVAFDGRNYPSLGYFVTSIGSLVEGGDKHLIFYVNGKEAAVGISSYVLRSGDSVVWKLE